MQYKKRKNEGSKREDSEVRIMLTDIKQRSTELERPSKRQKRGVKKAEQNEAGNQGQSQKGNTGEQKAEKKNEKGGKEIPSKRQKRGAQKADEKENAADNHRKPQTENIGEQRAEDKCVEVESQSQSESQKREQKTTENEDEGDSKLCYDSWEEEMLQLAKEAQQKLSPAERDASCNDWPVMVPGRLSLTGKKKFYDVSREEVKRRVGSPENLSSTMVCQLLKRSRSVANIPPGIVIRRNIKTSISLFSGLTEGEAKDLADDFSNIVEKSEIFSRLSKICSSRKEANEVRDVLLKAVDVLENIGDLEEGNRLTHGFMKPALTFVVKELAKHID
ncbi:transcriptional regulator ATRX homolog [Mytilus trossulus]|uniref:transcriptional regulator ATRX homolog n=1 Tax=Mytilus trossulus TaxID=6551 RepID=UPI00300663D4